MAIAFAHSFWKDGASWWSTRKSIIARTVSSSLPTWSSHCKWWSQIEPTRHDLCRWSACRGGWSPHRNYPTSCRRHRSLSRWSLTLTRAVEEPKLEWGTNTSSPKSCKDGWYLYRPMFMVAYTMFRGKEPIRWSRMPPRNSTSCTQHFALHSEERRAPPTMSRNQCGERDVYSKKDP